MRSKSLSLNGHNLSINASNLTLNGQVTLSEPSIPIPTDIMEFLKGRGWTYDTYTEGFSITMNNQFYGHMYWEQALAVEFYQFITLGGAKIHGQTKA